MLQAAVALEQGSCALVTNDRRLRTVEEIRVVLLDDLVSWRSLRARTDETGA